MEKPYNTIDANDPPKVRKMKKYLSNSLLVNPDPETFNYNKNLNTAVTQDQIANHRQLEQARVHEELIDELYSIVTPKHSHHYHSNIFDSPS